MAYDKVSSYILGWVKKFKSIEYLGGKCLECGTTDKFVMDFHHREGSKKSDNFNFFRTLSWDKIKVELDKCDLLCSNCHASIHYDDEVIDNKHRINKDVLLRIKNKYKCEKCEWDKSLNGLEFHHRDPNKKDFGLGEISRRLHIHRIPYYVALKAEVEKCDLLCRNCHRKEHLDVDRINNLMPQILEKVKTYKVQKRHNPTQIREWVKTMSYKEIERTHGVSRSTIHYYVKGKGKDIV